MCRSSRKSLTTEKKTKKRNKISTPHSEVIASGCRWIRENGKWQLKLYATTSRRRSLGKYSMKKKYKFLCLFSSLWMGSVFMFGFSLAPRLRCKCLSIWLAVQPYTKPKCLEIRDQTTVRKKEKKKRAHVSLFLENKNVRCFKGRHRNHRVRCATYSMHSLRARFHGRRISIQFH